MRKTGDPVVLTASFDAWTRNGAGAGAILASIMGTMEPSFFRSSIHAEMLARTLAWRLDGKDRPIDLWDAAKRPLRTCERDGRVVAVYSVGPDGRDDGGVQRHDLVWWLEAESPASP